MYTVYISYRPNPINRWIQATVNHLEFSNKRGSKNLKKRTYISYGTFAGLVRISTIKERDFGQILNVFLVHHTVFLYF